MHHTHIKKLSGRQLHCWWERRPVCDIRHRISHEAAASGASSYCRCLTSWAIQHAGSSLLTGLNCGSITLRCRQRWRLARSANTVAAAVQLLYKRLAVTQRCSLSASKDIDHNNGQTAITKPTERLAANRRRCFRTRATCLTTCFAPKEHCKVEPHTASRGSLYIAF